MQAYTRKFQRRCDRLLVVRWLPQSASLPPKTFAVYRVDAILDFSCVSFLPHRAPKRLLAPF
jgi:hypothetical protein